MTGKEGPAKTRPSKSVTGKHDEIVVRSRRRYAVRKGTLCVFMYVCMYKQGEMI